MTPQRKRAQAEVAKFGPAEFHPTEIYDFPDGKTGAELDTVLVNVMERAIAAEGLLEEADRLLNKSREMVFSDWLLLKQKVKSKIRSFLSAEGE